MARCFMAVCLLISLSVYCFSQPPDYYPSIDETDIPDARFEAPKTYNRASLFGYINGGAELYFEYGFSGAWINEIHWMGGTYKAEIYKMNGPEEAFGIFSVSRYQCKSSPPLSPFTCQTPYQLQICSGPFYISIINSTGNKADSGAMVRIGEAIVKKIAEKPADLTYYLPGIPREAINRDAVLVKGNLGLMNGAPDQVDFFGEAAGYSAVIMQHEGQINLSVRFRSQEDLDAFAKLHKWDSETITRIGELHLLITIRD